MMKRVLGATFLLFIFSSGTALAEGRDGQADVARDRYERVTREIEIKKRKHESLQRKERSLLDHLDRLAFALDRKTKQLRSLERERLQKERALLSQEDEVRRLRDQMSITQKHLRTRLVALYKASNVGPWAFLLSAENYGDFFRILTFLYSMIDHDGRLLATYEDQLQQEEALQKKLAANQSQLEEKEIKVRLKRQETEALERQEKGALRKVRAAKTSYLKVVHDLEKQAERLQSLIKTLSAQNERDFRWVSGFQALKGRLPLPVAGRIETDAGKRRGICLKAPLGAIVRGVYRGRVVYAGWFKGYGNLLIIDHGDKFHTVMGYASELLKGKDDWVETGEPVARVGSTGSLGGPSLYFEIRDAGMPVNPLDWFSREGRLALK